jgi:hypothetical protein
MNITPIVKQLEAERDRLNVAINTLRSLAGNHNQPTGGRTMSLAARRKIAAAQRARWAKIKKH